MAKELLQVLAQLPKISDPQNRESARVYLIATCKWRFYDWSQISHFRGFTVVGILKYFWMEWSTQFNLFILLYFMRQKKVIKNFLITFTQSLLSIYIRKAEQYVVKLWCIWEEKLDYCSIELYILEDTTYQFLWYST